jgi:hypothetical protein
VSDLSKWGLTDEQITGVSPALPSLPAASPLADSGQWGLSTEQVTSTDPVEALKQHIASSLDPVNEQAKIDSSIAMAKALSVSPGMVFQNYDSFATQWAGAPEKPLSFWKKLGNTLRSLPEQSNLDALSFRQITDKSPELQAHIDEAKSKAIPAKDQMDSVPRVLIGTFYGLGYQAVTGASFVADNIAALLSGEYLARASGQKPLTNFLGMAVSSGEKFSGSFMGATYRGLRDAGVQDGIATGAALGIGLLQAAVMGLRISQIPGIKKLTNEALVEAAKKAALNGIVESSVVTVGKRFVGSTLEQAAFGGAGASINAVGRELAIGLDNLANKGEIPHSAVVEILGEIGLGVLAGGTVGLVTGFPGAMIEGGRISKMAHEMAGETARRAETAPGPTMDIQVTHEPEVKTTVTDKSVTIEHINLADATPEEAAQAIVKVGRDNPGKTVEWTPIDEQSMAVKRNVEAANPRRMEQAAAIASKEAEVRALDAAIAKETAELAKPEELFHNDPMVPIQRLPDAPPKGYIRVYRGINPERSAEDPTHGKWFVTSYEEALNYANWDYQGTGELGPNRAILAVDIPERQAFKFAKAGSRRAITNVEELRGQSPVEMRVDERTMADAITYEDTRVPAVKPETIKTTTPKETDPAIKTTLIEQRAKAQAELTVLKDMADVGLQHFAPVKEASPVEPTARMEDFWVRIDKETQSSEAAYVKEDPVVAKLNEHITRLETRLEKIAVKNVEEKAVMQGRIDALRAAKNAKIDDLKAQFQRTTATRAEAVKNRAEVKKIVTSLREAQKKPMRPEFKAWVDEILAPFNLEAGTPRKLSKLAELKTRMEEMVKEGSADFSDSAMALLNEASAKDLTVLSMDEWRAVHNAVRYYVKAQNDFHGVKVRGKRIDRSIAAKNAQAEMPELKKVQDNIISSNPTLKEKIRGKAGSVLDFFGRRMTPWDHLMAVVGGGEDSVLYDAYKQVHGSDTEAVLSREGGQRGALKWTMDRNGEFTKVVESVAKRVGDIDKFRTEVVTMKMTSLRPGSARTVEKTVSLTRGDRIAMKFLMAQEDSRRDLVSSGFQFKNRKGRERWEPIRLSESQMQAVADSLTPDELSFYDAMCSGFKKAGQDVGKQYLEVHDFSMDLQQEYFPIDRMEVGRGTAPVADTAKEQFKKMYLNIGMPKGRTIERTHTVGPIYVRDAFEVFREHMEWAGQYINVDQPVLNAAKLLKDLQPDIVKRWGESMYTELEAGLRRVVNNAKDFNSIEKFMMTAKSGLVASTGSMNPIWWMNDVLGASRFYTSGLVDGKNYILGAMEALAHPTRVHKELMQWSTEYSKFRQELGFNKDMIEAMKAAKKTAVGRGLSTVRGVLAFPARVINRAMSRVGMKGAFNTAMEQLQSGKLSEQVKTALGIKDTAGLATEQKMALAYRYAEYALEHTQVVPMAEMHSSFQEGSWLEQTLATYGSDAIRAQTLMKETIRKAVNNPTAHNKAAVVKVMIGLLVFEPVAQQLAYDMRDKLAGRKPQSTVGMIGQEAYYFPVIRDIVRLASDAFTGRGIGGGSVLITDQAISMFKNLLTGFGDWVSGDTGKQRDSGMWKFIDNGVRMIMTGLRLPYSTPKTVIKALTK